MVIDLIWAWSHSMESLRPGYSEMWEGGGSEATTGKVEPLKADADNSRCNKRSQVWSSLLPLNMYNELLNARFSILFNPFSKDIEP